MALKKKLRIAALLGAGGIATGASVVRLIVSRSLYLNFLVSSYLTLIKPSIRNIANVRVQ